MDDGEQSRGGGPAEPCAPGALSALLLEIASSPAAGRDAWTDGLRAGAVVGRFELVRELGRGGFGVVWEARDRELGRRVAFKAVRAGAKRDLREERLLREAEAAARLSHPNIVTLHDVGRSEHGPYLVLELLEGRTLAERLAHGPLPAHEAVRVAVEIAKGLAHAHGHGVVHRDLKPENVFLCDDGQVKVLDFGLAHAFGRRKLDGGTPSYMAPEQLQGAPEDERTDVFALGVILHEMLTGRRPFEDERSLRSSRAAPALDVPWEPALGHVISRMLEKQPVRRPREGGEVLRALTTFASELERSPRVIGRIGTRRRPDWRIAAALAVLLALPGAAAIWWVASRDHPAAPATRPDGRIVVAVADMVNETGERELDVLSGLLVTSLEQSRRLAVMTQARVLDLAARDGRKDVARVDETVGREVGRAHGVRALLLPAMRRLGTTYSIEMRAIDPQRDEHLFTLSDRATSKEGLLDLLDRLSEKARTRLGEGLDEIDQASVRLGDAMTRSLDAYGHYLSGLEAWLREGQRATGLREFEEALRLDPGFAAAHAQVAQLLYHSYDLPALAAPHWKAAEAGLARMPEKERLLFRLKRAHYSSSFEHFSREEALRLADEAVTRFPDDKFSVTSAADAFETFDLPDRWEPALRRALALDPGYYWAAVSLAYQLGPRTTEALEVARRAVVTRRSAANLSILATALWATGDEDGAVAAAREVLHGEGGGHSLLVARACDVLREKGIGAECLPVWRRMVAEGLNEHERDFARARLAEALVHRGRIREALRSMETAPAFTRVVSPEWLARIHLVGHHRTDAREALEAARRIPNPQFRRNWLQWLGATEEAERITALLQGRGYEVTEKIGRAIDLANRGRPAEAVDLIAVVREEMRRRNYSTWTFSQAAFHAEVLLASGRAAEAATIWPATFPCRCTDSLDHAGFYPVLAVHRARAMERLGRYADAVRELAGVLAFWKEADADLPLLVEAKAMRKRILAARSAAHGSAEPAGPSIAVLPFADLSPGKDQEHFADGIAEEILNALTQMQGLRVVGRTSSFSFKGKNEDLRSIGQKLGVRTLLEGSVRKAGDRVRITAQLVSASDGYHLWSQSYDRELTDVFAVQDDIARAVVSALEVKLLAGRHPSLVELRTSNPEVYDLYLLARQLGSRGSEQGLRRAAAELEKAIELDSNYAPAWAALATTLWGLSDIGETGGTSIASLQQRAMQAADRVVQLAPDVSDSHLVRASLRILTWDWAGARSDLDRALRLGAQGRLALAVESDLLSARGKLREAIELEQEVVRHDPLSSAAWNWLGWLQYGSGDLDAAERALTRSLEIAPDNAWAIRNLTWVALARRQPAAALELAARSTEEVLRLKVAAMAHHDLGHRAESQVALDALVARHGASKAWHIAAVFAWRGEREGALDWLERAYAQRDLGLRYIRYHPPLRVLHGHPRFTELLRKLKLADD